MFVICFILWIIFNARISTEVLLTGFAAAALISVFCRRFLGYTIAKDIAALKKTGAFLKYLCILVWETVLANFEVSKIVFSKKIEISPCIIFFKTDLKSKAGRVLLADSITLTPGTITVMLDDDILCVHCIDKKMMTGIEDSSFVKQLRKMDSL